VVQDERGMKLAFTIPGEPTGKGRPRFVRATGRTYTPEKTVNYEALVKMCCAEAMKQQGWELKQDGALELTVKAYMRPAASTSKKRLAAMLSGEIRPTKKPDYDNIGKTISDALNGIAYRDDAQITDAVVRKRYALEPRVEVEICR
jgi:Holliday junction resolvase RusA-like endonuclease